VRRPRIHRRFLWPFIAFIVSGALVAWLLGNLMYAATLERRLTDQLEHAAGVLADGALPLTPGLLARLARLLRANIALLGKDHAGVTFSTAPIPAALFRTLPASDAGPAAPVVAFKAAGFVAVRRALPAGRDDRYGAILITADLSDIRRASRRSALWLGLAAMAAVVGLTWLLHRIGRSITQPVEALSRMAEAIARGERDVRVRVERDDEFGEVASALNAMTERLARYEQEMVRQDRMAALGNMAARIAHEIRNPLTAIKLNVQLLTEDLPPDRRATVVTLEREMDRLELIVAGVLSQAQGAPTRLERCAIDPGRLVSETTALFEAQFKHQGIDLQTRLAEPLPEARLDPDRLKQVLLNLLVNARDALPDGGRVLVTCRHDPDTADIVITVADDGPGLDPTPRALRVGTDTSTKPMGLGLGLPLSRELVAAHGGTLILGRSTLGGVQADVRLPLDATHTEAE
jgi:signal transduction histidine kinase